MAGFFECDNEASLCVEAFSFLGQLNKYERSERPRTVDLGISISIGLRAHKSSAILCQRRLPNVV